jgi:membrane protein DedA with SNARE-associated domain
MPVVPFAIYSTIGTTLWVLFLTSAGLALGKNYQLVDEYLAPVSKIVLAILLIVFLVWLGKRIMNRKAS